MQKLIKVNKSNLENMIVNEYKDLNLIALQVRSLKMQIDSLNELIDAQGITCFGTSHIEVKLKAINTTTELEDFILTIINKFDPKYISRSEIPSTLNQIANDLGKEIKEVDDNPVASDKERRGTA